MIRVMKSVASGVMAVAAAAAMVACGGGGGGGSSNPPVAVKNETPAGLWQTSYVVTSGPNTGNTIKSVAIVSTAGTFYSVGINQNNGCGGISFGQAAVTGSSLSANTNAFIIQYSQVPGVNVNCTYPDGTTSGTGTVTGTVISGQSLVLTSQGKTSKGTALTSDTTTFTWSPRNSIQPSLALTAGTYKSSSGSPINISAQGAISGQDPETGCTVNGTLSIPSTSYNVYDVSFKYSNCSATYAALNNVVVTGLATYDNSTAPSTLTFAMNATINGTLIVIVNEISKM